MCIENAGTTNTMCMWRGYPFCSCFHFALSEKQMNFFLCLSMLIDYFLVDQYWDNNGPIFFYTGNEGSITSFWDNSGFVFEAAEQFNALVIFGEHVSLNFHSTCILCARLYCRHHQSKICSGCAWILWFSFFLVLEERDF